MDPEKDLLLQAIFNTRNVLNACEIIKEWVTHEQDKLLDQLNNPSLILDTEQPIRKGRGRPRKGITEEGRKALSEAMKARWAAGVLGKRGGRKGGLQRAANLNSEERSSIAAHAANCRWDPNDVDSRGRKIGKRAEMYGRKLSPKHKKAVLAALKRRWAEYKRLGAKNWADCKRLKAMEEKTA